MVACSKARAARGANRRILLVTSNFPRWKGDSTTPFILHLAQDLQRVGWEILVLAPHAAGALRSETLEGVAVERFRYLWPASAQTVCYDGGALINLRRNKANLYKTPAFVAAEIAVLVRKLSSRRHDLVHSHWVLPQGFAAGVASRLTGVPHVVTVHGGDVFALRGKVLTEFKRAAFRFCDAITVNSSATQQAVEEIGRGSVPLLKIPMGASAPVEANDDRVAVMRSAHRRGHGPLIAFVGRLIAEKGAADLLRAVASVRMTHPDATCLVVGDGPERRYLVELARQLRVEDIVTFTGWVGTGEVGAVLRAADVFVAPSKRSMDGWVEAQGLSIVEAMLASVPVIATEIGGITDVVFADRTGLLVPEASPQALASAIVRLHESPELRARLIANARTLASRELTREVSAERFSDLFKQLIAR